MRASPARLRRNRWLREARFSRGPWIMPFVIASTVALYSFVLIGLGSSGRIGATSALVALSAPALAWCAVFRPAWLIYGLLALPPALTFLSPLRSPGYWCALLLVVLVWQLSRESVKAEGLVAHAWPLALLVALSGLHQAPVTSTAAEKADQLQLIFLYYFLLMAVCLLLVSRNQIGVGYAAIALVTGTVISDLWLALAFAGDFGALSRGGPATATYETLQGRAGFAYVGAMAYGVALARAFRSNTPNGRIKKGSLALAGVLLLFVALTYVRGALLGCLILTAITLGSAGRRRYLVGVLAGLILILSFTTVTERLTRGAEGRVGELVTSSTFTTGRTKIWGALWDRAQDGFPWGNGFGYVWSLDPQALLGTQNWGYGNFIYPHNDIVFLAVELGVPGLLLFVAFWALLVRAMVRVWRNPSLQTSFYQLGSVAVVMVPAHMFGNGLLVPLMGERFSIFAGLLLGLGMVSRRRSFPAAEPEHVGSSA